MESSFSRFKAFLCLFLSFVFFLPISHAEESLFSSPDQIIYGQRSSSPRKGGHISQSHTLSGEVIRSLSPYDANDAMRYLPGLQTQRSGGIGQSTTYRMRGSQTSHILVLVDGMELNDPISTSGLFTGDFLSMLNIKKIEVIKGPQTLSYGSRALGGIISITTRNGQGVPTNSSSNELGLALGSQKYYSPSFIRRTNINDEAHYALAYEYRQTQGFNVTSQTTRENPSKEGARSQNAHLHYNKVFPKAQINSTFHFNSGKSDLDAGFGQERDRSRAGQEVKNFHGIIEVQTEHFLSIDLTKLSFHHGQNESKSFFLKEPFQQEDHTFSYDSSVSNLHLQLNESVHNNIDLNFSFEWLRKEGSFEERMPPIGPEKMSPHKTDTWGVSQSINFFHKNLSLYLGGRYENHNTYSEQLLYSVMPGVDIPSLYGHLNFKLTKGENAPSLYQLYSQRGNLELESEQTTSYELNFSVNRSGLDWGGSAFYQQTDRLIDTNEDFSLYINQGEIDSYGSEFWISTYNEYYFLNFGITQLMAKDKTNNQRRVDSPSLSKTLSAGLNLTSHWSGQADLFYKSRRKSGTSFSQTELPSYLVAGIGVEYKRMNLSFNLKVNNLFDHQYEDIFGYNSSGRTARLKTVYHF